MPKLRDQRQLGVARSLVGIVGGDFKPRDAIVNTRSGLRVGFQCVIHKEKPVRRKARMKCQSQRAALVVESEMGSDLC